MYIYIYIFAAQQEEIMPPEFYSYIYTNFSRESFSSVSNTDLLNFINSKYKIPDSASGAVFNDYMKTRNSNLNVDIYEDFMKILYNSDQTILNTSIEEFKNCDKNNDGYIDSVDENIILNSSSYDSLHPIFDYIHRFDTNRDGKLNILDFYSFMDKYYNNLL